MVPSLQRLPTVQGRTGLARSTIYRRMLEGSFPEPIPIGGGRVAWISTDIDDWIEARIQEGRTESSK